MIESNANNAGALRPGEKEKKMKKILGRILMLVALLLALGGLTSNALAGSDVTEIVDGATSVFGTVATICVAMGVFFIGYRIARKIR